MRVFISQPMREKSDDEIISERLSIISKLNMKYVDSAVEIIESFFKGEARVHDNPLYYLGKSLELLSTADIAVFTRGWEDARGCRIEHQCCIDYNIPSIESRDL